MPAVSSSSLQNGADGLHSPASSAAAEAARPTASLRSSWDYNKVNLSAGQNDRASPHVNAPAAPLMNEAIQLLPSPLLRNTSRSSTASAWNGSSSLNLESNLRAAEASTTDSPNPDKNWVAGSNHDRSQQSNMTTATATTTTTAFPAFFQQPTNLFADSPRSPPPQAEPFDIYIYGARQQRGPSLPSDASNDMQRASSPSLSYHEADAPSSHILALPPFSSPTDSPHERPSTPTFHTVNSKVGHSTDERLRYQSWRKGLPMLGGRFVNRPDGGGALVDKKIEATLPRSEQTAVARSRKTSHVLGIFNRNQPATGQHVETAPSSSTATVEQSSRDLRTGHPAKDMLSQTQYTDDASISAVKPAKTSEEAEALPNRSRRESLITGRHASQADTHPEATKLIVRSETAGGDPRPSLAYEAPSQQSSEASSSTITTEDYIASSNIQRSDDPESVRVAESGSRADAGRQGSLTDEDETELIQKEHISSAIYYPHRAAEQVIRRPSTALTGDDRESSGLRDQAPLKSEESSETSGSRSRSRTKTDREIEITLQSEDKQHRFHGELSPSASLSDEEEEDDYIGQSSESGGGFTTSESEVDLTEAEDSSQVDDLSGNQTPKAGASFIRSHRKSRLAQAIELKPFDHQVGGHTALYRFSDRAVCKKLNNKENKFYETVERFHPDLLDFLPRYIGVLNVTFEKTMQRRKSKKNNSNAVNAEETTRPKSSYELKNSESKPSEWQSLAPPERRASEMPRVVSHSQQMLPTPEVYINMNRHIIPGDLFTSAGRTRSLVGQSRRHSHSPYTSSNSSSVNVDNKFNKILPSGLGQNTTSWGATIVNSQLQAQVMREVFAPTPIHHRRRKRAMGYRLSRTDTAPSGHPSLSRVASDESESSGGGLRASIDEAYLSDNVSAMDTSKERAIRADDGSDSLQSTLPLDSDNTTEGSRSAAMDISIVPEQAFRRVPRRRASGSGLVNKQKDVNSAKRSDLQFFDEDSYSGDAEDEVFSMDQDLESRRSSSSSSLPQPADQVKPEDSSLLLTPRQSSASKDVAPGGVMLPAPLEDRTTSSTDYENVPLNPKEAALEANQRVDEFLLLEDLTSGMSKPCTLDLKMGTRQYGLDADDKKQASQRMKCKMTTSYELGVRVCGMQTYDITSRRYIWQDKYFGRDLRVGTDFQKALKSFFFNGVDYQAAQRNIPIALQKINALEQMVRNLPGYRFYGSSLYIIYDGGEDADVKAAHRTRHHHSSSSSSGNRNRSGEQQMTMEDQDGQPQRSEILVKIIDFANCVTKETTNLRSVACPPSNPDDIDRGYLRGLKSLAFYFKKIWRELSEADWRPPHEQQQQQQQQQQQPIFASQQQRINEATGGSISSSSEKGERESEGKVSERQTPLLSPPSPPSPSSSSSSSSSYTNGDGDDDDLGQVSV